MLTQCTGSIHIREAPTHTTRAVSYHLSSGYGVGKREDGREGVKRERERLRKSAHEDLFRLSKVEKFINMQRIHICPHIHSHLQILHAVSGPADVKSKHDFHPLLIILT